MRLIFDLRTCGGAAGENIYRGLKKSLSSNHHGITVLPPIAGKKLGKLPKILYPCAVEADVYVGFGLISPWAAKTKKRFLVVTNLLPWLVRSLRLKLPWCRQARYLILRKFAEMSASMASAIFVWSNFAANVLSMYIRRPVFVVPRGVYIPEKTAKCNDLPEKFLLNVSEIAPHKNIELCIRTLPLLPENIPLILCGQITCRSYYRNLLQLAQNLGVSKLVKFLGRRPPEVVRFLYEKASIVIDTSIVESFRSTNIEALLLNGRLVCHANPLNVEICGELPFYFYKRSPQELVLSIGSALTLPQSTASQIIEKAKRRFQKYSWTSLIEFITSLSNNKETRVVG